MLRELLIGAGGLVLALTFAIGLHRYSVRRARRGVLRDVEIRSIQRRGPHTPEQVERDRRRLYELRARRDLNPWVGRRRR